MELVPVLTEDTHSSNHTFTHDLTFDDIDNGGYEIIDVCALPSQFSTSQSRVRVDDDPIMLPLVNVHSSCDLQHVVPVNDYNVSGNIDLTGLPSSDVDIRPSVPTFHNVQTHDGEDVPLEDCVQTVTSTHVQSSAHTNVTPQLRLIDVVERGHVSSHVYASPNGTMFWKPDVSDEFKPSLDVVYDTWEDVVKMYRLYAEKAGFTTRLGTAKKTKTDKTISHRHIMCNRASKPLFRSSNTGATSSLIKRRRRTKSKRVNCKACIRVSPIPGTTKFQIYAFYESHNHSLVEKDNVDLTRKRRNLGFYEQNFIHKLSLNKIGATKAHKLQCAIKGGPQNVRGTATDYKNFARDVRIYIADRDAELVVENLSSRVLTLNNFYFYHEVVDGELRFLFWADGVSRCNYEAFGDVLAFDATYKTNQYGMIFVPFTGVDHHTRSVTFGAALLVDETIDSYKLLLQTFLKAHTKQPLLVLTDQDSSMKSAIKSVFTESKHRLCMWHIMDKLPSKISSEELENTDDLRASIHELVWDLIIEPSTFEERWHTLIASYKLENHTWLKNMYAIREDWVPAYFKDLSMSCLMKTTSRCESSNAMFKVNSSASNTLVQFLMCFDTAIDWQRYHQREAEFASDMSTHSFKTDAPIEIHASVLYTSALFLKVQHEIDRSTNRCIISGTSIVNGITHYKVTHFNPKREIIGDFQVDFNPNDNSASCTCMLFGRLGYLCRHIFIVFHFNKVDRIPEQYVLKRWKRDALPKWVHSIDHRYSADNDEESKLRNDIIDMVVCCADRLRSRPDKLISLRDEISAIKDRVFEDIPNDPPCNKKDAVISGFYGKVRSGPDNVPFVPPNARHKGSRSDKRLVGAREKAVKQHRKGPRRCNECGKIVYDHDSRNCKKVAAAKAAAVAAAAVESAASAAASTIISA
ncbi:hypothetical protein SSX86_030360, partial [Deinandra increscens subsp. villosa]